jgi:hypothetical protein
MASGQMTSRLAIVAALSALVAGIAAPLPGASKSSAPSAMKGEKIPEGSSVTVGYQIGAPHGWTEKQGGNLVWREPRLGETHSIAVTVQEPKGDRAVHGCAVSVWLTGADGKDIGSSTPLSFMWAADFARYMANVSLPAGLTSATLMARVEPPDYPRLGKEGGAFFPAGFTVSWPAVEVPPPAPASVEAGAPPGYFTESRHPRVEPTPYPGAGTMLAEGKTTPTASAP